MSIFYLFDIVKLNAEFSTEYEIFGDILDFDDVVEWRDATAEVTGRKPQITPDITADDALIVIDDILTAELENAKMETIPSPELTQMLFAYYEFEYRAFVKEFRDEFDVETYNELLFNCLRGSDAKNYEPTTDIYKIRVKFWDIIEEEIYRSLKNYKLDIIDKFKIIGEFCENYEGQDATDSDFLRECTDAENGIYCSFFKNETLGELLKSFADWYFEFWNWDENGEPFMETPHSPQYYAHCINWRRLY